MTGFCDICKKEFKNLGAHMYQSHKGLSFMGEVPPEVSEASGISGMSEIQVDEVIKEKPLSVLISEIKDLLKPYQNELVIRIAEKGGRMREIEITARIQL